MLRTLLFSIVFLQLSCGLALGEGSLRIATEGAYPPFNYIDASGELVGFDVDIAHALCEEMNKECNLVAVPWNDLLNGLTQERYDIIIASMARTPQREQFANFTQYYYRSRSTFVGDPKQPFIQTRKGVTGLTLTAQTNTVQAEYLLDNFKGTATIKLAPSTKEAFAMLARGETNAVLSDSLTIFDFLQTPEGNRFGFIGTPLPQENPSSEACIAVRKTAPKLLNEINDAIRDIRLNGTYENINRKYFPFSIY